MKAFLAFFTTVGLKPDVIKVLKSRANQNVGHCFNVWDEGQWVKLVFSLTWSVTAGGCI